jgi:uncharacterized protein YqfB (UPF0267 family)
LKKDLDWEDLEKAFKQQEQREPLKPAEPAVKATTPPPLAISKSQPKPPSKPKPAKVRPASQKPHRIADLSFTLRYAQAIERGELTLTLRAMPPNLFTAGQRLAVKVRDYAQIEVLEVSRKRLGDLTEEDAKAEGRYSLEEFRRVWAAAHNGFRRSEFVTVLRFRLALE